MSSSPKRLKPFVHRLAGGVYRLFVKKTERQRIAERLAAEYRTSELFEANNT